MLGLSYSIGGDNKGLVSSINDSIKKIQDLNTSIAGIGNQLNKATPGAKAFSQALTDDKNAAALDKLSQKLLVVNGNASLFGATLKTDRSALSAYQQALNSLLSNGVAPLDSRVQGLKIKIDGLNESISSQKSSSGNGLTGQLSGMVAGYISLYAAIAGVGKIININAEISDSLADVRRTAGLTAREAENLATQLGKIDTRTSLKGLLDIAVIGGQLGIAKDQLAGFTKAVDELSVTLSGEIKGGAESVASALGKINGVFSTQSKEGTDTETAFNKTGSAILALGQAGLATGEFLQDFTLRVAGIAKTANISLPTILAYSAVLEETGSSAEVAGTAFNRLVGNLASKRDKFFAIAQLADSTLTLKSFTQLINTDANAALQKFFAGLNAGGKDLTSFTDLLDSIKIKGGPARNAITALAQNQTLLNERIGESVKAYNDGTLASDQFAIKNDNLASSISKLSNEFSKGVTSGNIAAFFKGIVDGLTDATHYFSTLVNSKGFNEFFDRISTITQKGEKSNDLRFNTLPAGANAAGYTKDLTDFASTISQPKQNADLQKRITDQFTSNTAALKLLRDGYNQLQKQNKDGSISDFDKETLQRIATYIDLIKERQSELYKFAEAAKTVQKAQNDSTGKTLDTTKVKKTSPDFDNLSASLDSIFRKTSALASESGLKDYELQVQKINDRYKETNAQIDELIKKAKLDLKNGNITSDQFSQLTGKGDRDKNSNELARQKELSDARIAEAQRVASEVQRINDEFGVKSKQGKDKELAQIDRLYDAEVAKARGNVDLLNAAENGRIAAKKAINDKYLQLEQDLQDKIAVIDNLAISTISGREESETAKIQSEWERRRQAAEKYYNQLLQIASTDVSSSGLINDPNKEFKKLAIQQSANTTDKNITSASGAEVTRYVNKTLVDGITQAAGSFYTTLTEINQQTDKSFKAIFSDLTASLEKSFNNIFTNILEKQLTKALENSINNGLLNANGSPTTLGYGVAGAGLLGGVISGSTSKTSALGQGIGGALTGAAIGTAILPGIGTAAGAIIGGIAGIFSANKAQKELQAQQLEQQKEQTALLKASLAYTSQIIGRQTANGVISNISVGATGQLVATVSGSDLQFVLDRNGNAR